MMQKASNSLNINHLKQKQQMKTAYNFNAGPCVLPKEAIESTIAAIRDFDNIGDRKSVV